MPVGSAISSSLPVVGVTAGPTWASDLITWCNEVETAIEAKVTQAGINLTGALEMNGQELQEIGALLFTSKASAFATANSLYERDGELYWNNSSGTQLKMTNAGALNASAIGGIGGDYGGANSALVSYSEANSRYTFFEDGSTTYGQVETGDLIVKRTGESSPNGITIKSPASLAAAYSLELPDALPAAEGVLGLTTAGKIQVITDLAHGNYVRVCGPHGGYSTFANSDEDSAISSSGGQVHSIPLDVKVGDVIKSFSIYVKGSASGQMTVRFYDVDMTADSRTDVANSTSVASATLQTLVLNPTDTPVVAGHRYMIVCEAGVAALEVYGVAMTYDRP